MNRSVKSCQGAHRTFLRESAAIAVLVLTACNPLGPASTRGLEKTEFSITGHPFTMMVPEGTVISERPPSMSRVTGLPESDTNCWIRFPSSQRILKIILLSGSPISGDLEYSESIELASGATLDFSSDPHIGAGSGGVECGLSGILSFGKHRISVTCRDQGEWGMDPNWCIPYLHHLILNEKPPGGGY